MGDAKVFDFRLAKDARDKTKTLAELREHDDPCIRIAQRFLDVVRENMHDVGPVDQLVGLQLTASSITEAVAHGRGREGALEIAQKATAKAATYTVKWPIHDDHPTCYDRKESDGEDDG